MQNTKIVSQISVKNNFFLIFCLLSVCGMQKIISNADPKKDCESGYNSWHRESALTHFYWRNWGVMKSWATKILPVLEENLSPCFQDHKPQEGWNSQSCLWQSSQWEQHPSLWISWKHSTFQKNRHTIAWASWKAT